MSITLEGITEIIYTKCSVNNNKSIKLDLHMRHIITLKEIWVRFLVWLQIFFQIQAILLIYVLQINSILFDPVTFTLYIFLRHLFRM